MKLYDIYSGTVIGSFPDDLRSGQEKRRDRRKKERKERWRKIQEDAIHFNKNVFLTKKHAKSALAMAQISQLISYYGGEITDEEWMDNSMRKYALLRNNNKIKLVDGCLMVYSFLVFHTEEQRDEFLKNNEQLVKDYLMIE